MPSKPAERRARKKSEPRKKTRSRLEKKTSRITLSGRFLAAVVGLSTFDTFFTHALPTLF